MLTKKQSIALINQLFDAIPYQVQSGFSTAKDDLFALNKEAEKKHRKGAYSSHYNCPIGTIAKYFTVLHLFDGMKAATGERKGYTITAILHIRFECLKAQAYAEENVEKLQEWYTLVKASEFSTLDYVELVK